MSVSRNHGQSALELAVLFSVVLIALLALSRYVRFAVGGRLKSSGEGLSQTLFDASRTTTTWSSAQNLHDQVYTNSYTRSEVVDHNATSNRTDAL